MKVRVEQDKIRIIDSGAKSHRKLVHAVEISDESSHQQFVTAYTKTFVPDWEAIHAGHNPELYHREGNPQEWVSNHCVPTEKQSFSGWSTHYHLLFETAPVIESFGVFISGMSNELIREIREYFDVSTR